jgi:hypothetical protein
MTATRVVARIRCPLVGKASWFLVLSAVGAPVFFVVLLVIERKNRS